MLASRQIETGKSYVNNKGQSARQVLNLDCDTVSFCTYDLKTGRLCSAPHEKCTKDEIIHWADREATRGESNSLNRQELDALFRLEDASPGKEPQRPDDPTAGLLDQARRVNFMR